MDKKENLKQIVRQEVGWLYSDLLWLSEEQAQRTNNQRNELLAQLSGWVTFSYNGSKPHVGPLSPGCLICGNGGWGCNFINICCTRHCFYCAQDRTLKKERESETDGIVFNDPAEHILFLKTFKIKGVGFIGGEPLLVLDRLLAHISAIRRELGDSIYIWMYTNGDLVNREVLQKLRAAGLDEIRFNLSARSYNLDPVILAKEFIPAVTVEMPAIPEDFDLLKNLLEKMEAIGVNFLNLHQIIATKHNYKALLKRRYHFLHQPNIPVMESEMCALQLLNYARENRLNLPINYCSAAYRSRFMGLDLRQRQGRVVLKGFEEITNAAYIRSFRVSDAPDKIIRMVRRFEEHNCPPALWQCNGRKTEVAIHSDLLRYVDWSSAEVTLVYSEPGIRLKNQRGGVVEDNLEPMNTELFKATAWSEIATESWRRLYKEGRHPEEVFKFLFQNYPLGGDRAISDLQKEMNDLKQIAAWEEVESGLPELV
jgi:pyruvate formate-lyase activating enzyme-like uncharacterized protein